MDENFLRMACERPFYVRHKTKSALLKAVVRDAKFLCDIKVMDYSLLGMYMFFKLFVQTNLIHFFAVGKDMLSNELVVGIIDYLRPFSIDKILESQVKKTTGYFQVNLKMVSLSQFTVIFTLVGKCRRSNRDIACCIPKSIHSCHGQLFCASARFLV